MALCTNVMSVCEGKWWIIRCWVPCPDVATPLPSFQGLIGLIEMRAFTSQERAFRNAAQGQAYHQAGVILEALFSSEQVGSTSAFALSTLQAKPCRSQSFLSQVLHVLLGTVGVEDLGRAPTSTSIHFRALWGLFDCCSSQWLWRILTLYFWCAADFLCEFAGHKFAGGGRWYKVVC